MSKSIYEMDLGELAEHMHKLVRLMHEDTDDVGHAFGSISQRAELIEASARHAEALVKVAKSIDKELFEAMEAEEQEDRRRCRDYYEDDEDERYSSWEI